MHRIIAAFLFSLALLIPVASLSQIVMNKPQEIATTDLVFDPAFVKKNKIKTITIDLANKPDNKVIDDKGLVQHCEFDAEGRLSRYYYTILSGTKTREIEVPAVYRRGRVVRKAYTRTENTYSYDTISTNYYYDNAGRITIKRTNAGEFFQSVYYTYDMQDGSLIKEVRCRETNASENRNEFRLGVQTLTSLETFTYEKLSPTQIKKRSLNDEGRVYKQTIINYNSQGNKLDENAEYVVTWMTSTDTWKYDAQGRVIEKTSYSNTTGNARSSAQYEYDAKGNLTGEKRFKDQLQTNEISYLYDESGLLLRSQVNRDILNKQIGIIKYSYTFYK